MKLEVQRIAPDLVTLGASVARKQSGRATLKQKEIE